MGLSSGLTIACEPRSGSVVELYFANKDDVTSFTYSGGKYTAVTMVAGKVFYKFEFEEFTAERREDGSRVNGSTLYKHAIEFLIPKPNSINRDAVQSLMDASCCGVICISKDGNGLKWVTGYSENFKTQMALKVQSDATKSGKSFTDMNASTIILNNEDTTKDVEFTGSIPV